MPDRFADTKIDADGRRVPVSEFEEAASSPRSTKVDPDTQIAADGTRVPTESINPDQVAPVGRTAEARLRDERAEHIAGSETPAVNGTGISSDVETGGASASSDEPGDPLDDMTKAELREVADELDIDGRASMNKDELLDAVKAAQG